MSVLYNFNMSLLNERTLTYKEVKDTVEKVIDFFEKSNPDFIATNTLGIDPDAKDFKAEEEDEDQVSMV